jgi:hypothetical protein
MHFSVPYFVESGFLYRLGAYHAGLLPNCSFAVFPLCFRSASVLAFTGFNACSQIGRIIGGVYRDLITCVAGVSSAGSKYSVGAIACLYGIVFLQYSAIGV